MAALPEEIITRILYFAPAKCIGRFRSVSKGWLSLLTHPDFIKTHRNALDKLHLIYFTTESNVIFPALYSNPYQQPFLKPSDFESDLEMRDLLICGSCNGLVLVFAEGLGVSEILVLLNPTTKESMKLPDIVDTSYLRGYEYIEYDNMYGLGYDDCEMGGDFKVVSLTCVHESEPILTNGSIFVDVYSLKMNTWRHLTDPLDDYYSISPMRESAFVNGSLHWVTTKSTVNGGLRPTVILAFSLADEKFSEVPSPEFVQSTEYLSSDYCRFVVLGGKLAFFHEMEGEIWLMNLYRIKESWTKILLHGIPKAVTDGDDKPMVFYHDGKFMVAYKDRMMVYDDEKGTFEETACVWDLKNFKVYGSYIESLVSIKSCIGK